MMLLLEAVHHRMETQFAHYIYFLKQEALAMPFSLLPKAAILLATVTKWCILPRSYHIGCLIWISNLIFWVERHHCY